MATPKLHPIIEHCRIEGCHNLACNDGLCLRCEEEINALADWMIKQDAKPKHRFWSWFLERVKVLM